MYKSAAGAPSTAAKVTTTMPPPPPKPAAAAAAGKQAFPSFSGSGSGAHRTSGGSLAIGGSGAFSGGIGKVGGLAGLTSAKLGGGGIGTPAMMGMTSTGASSAGNGAGGWRNFAPKLTGVSSGKVGGAIIGGGPMGRVGSEAQAKLAAPYKRVGSGSSFAPAAAAVAPHGGGGMSSVGASQDTDTGSMAGSLSIFR